MILTVGSSGVAVLRDISDPLFHGDDSRFLYHVKKSLVRLGYDCIKKKAWKDGHLVDNEMYYIRSRDRVWYLYDPRHAERSCARDFDNDRTIILSLVGRMDRKVAR